VLNNLIFVKKYFYPKFCPQPMLEHSVDHFSRYCNEFLLHVFKIICQNMLKNEISIHKFCPQSVLKHSVVHFQGMAMKFLKMNGI